MNSTVIKFVAGGGKTTESKKIMKSEKNGLYLAFTNSVVEDLNNSGILSKTIDSFFTSFIIPKFTSFIPLIGTSSKVKYIDSNNLPPNLVGISNIKIDLDGNLYNKSKLLNVTINTSNSDLQDKPNSNSLSFIKFIFGKYELRLTHELRSELSNYLIYNYPNEIINFIKYRFSFVIIDEAQDLNNYREKFAELLFNSEIKLVLLGDDNQNIMNGGDWFENLTFNVTKTKSFRCPETNCQWIRNNLGIEIYGNSTQSEFIIISFEEIMDYDNGIRTLLYNSKAGKNKNIVDLWNGPKCTIKFAKGSTIETDIVIIGDKLNKKNYYTAITRTTKRVYTTIKNFN